MDQPQPVYRLDYRPPTYAIDSVDLTVELAPRRTLVRSRLLFRRLPLADDAEDDPSLLLRGENLELLALRLDGAELPAEAYELDERGLRLLRPPATGVLETEVAIDPEANTELSGLYRSGGTYCTQCEAEGFRRITFHPDRPDVLSRYRCSIIAEPQSCPVLLSNGNRIAVDELPDGRRQVTWEDPHPKPSYLFALVAGDLHCHSGDFTTQSGRPVRLEIWVEPENHDKCAHALASLQAAMAWDEAVYGREYDLDIYMIVAVNDFNMGAMENKGLNVFNSKYVLARSDTASDDDYEGIESVIAHEYFHNWTGNRITCRDWFQLTLKEGLTVFRDQQFTADRTSAAVKRIDDVSLLRRAQFPEDAGPMRHPIRPESYIAMDNFYTATVYNKGAEVIRMFHTLLGPEGWRRGMDLYFDRHDGQAVTCDDFRQALADANEIDLAAFEGWYTQAGTPRLTVSSSYADDGLLVRLQQSGPIDDPDRPPLPIPLRLACLGPDGAALTSRLDDTTAHEHVHLMTRQQEDLFLAEVAPGSQLSILRDFSAPVELIYERSNDDLRFAMQHETDPFNQWEAGQRYAKTILQAGIASLQTGGACAWTVDEIDQLAAAYAAILERDDLDDRLKALALILPTQQELAQAQQVIDPDAIADAHRSLRQHIAGRLATAFFDRYQELARVRGGPDDARAVGARRLKQVCLRYFFLADPERAGALAEAQFEQADCMTDAQGALRVLADGDHRRCLDDFYKRWQGDALVIDKWFSLQALADRPTQVEDLQRLARHPDFTLSNPNRTRSLLGAFAMGNQVHFHRADGAGYRLVIDHLRQLVGRNPQLAARLTTAFNQWRRYEPIRADLQKQALEELRQLDDCSTDVREVIDRALI